jgi:glycosyltransferase involved in cell wall biosynthesis
VTGPWLIVAGDFTPLGGMDAANYALARYLASLGEVHLVTHRAWPDLEAAPSVTLHRVRRPFNRHLLGSALLARTGQQVWDQLRPRGAHAIVNGGNCQIDGTNWIHYLHAAYTPVIAGSVARRSKTRWTHQRDVAAERAALARAQTIICNSARTRTDVIERIGVEPSRAHVVYYGSDRRRFGLVSPPERIAAREQLQLTGDAPLLGFIGALGDRRKAFDTVFHAFVDLCARPQWDAQLIVVGTGAELPMWRRRATEAGVDRRIRFIGFRDDVPTVLAALDAVVHPARYEAYGLAVHEALCRGVPAIVSASAGVAERYPADLGDLLVRDPDSPGELAERLRVWRSALERFRDRVKQLSVHLHEHTWDHMAAEMTALVARAYAA